MLKRETICPDGITGETIIEKRLVFDPVCFVCKKEQKKEELYLAIEKNKKWADFFEEYDISSECCRRSYRMQIRDPILNIEKYKTIQDIRRPFISVSKCRQCQTSLPSSEILHESILNGYSWKKFMANHAISKLCCKLEIRSFTWVYQHQPFSPTISINSLDINGAGLFSMFMKNGDIESGLYPWYRTNAVDTISQIIETFEKSEMNDDVPKSVMIEQPHTPITGSSRLHQKYREKILSVLSK